MNSESSHNHSHIFQMIVTDELLQKYHVTLLSLLSDHQEMEKFCREIIEHLNVPKIFLSNHLTFSIMPRIKHHDYKIIIKSNSPVPTAKNPKLIHKNINPTHLRRVKIKFTSFEKVILISKQIQTKVSSSNLYQYGKNYYLELMFPQPKADSQLNQIKNIVSLAYEFGAISIITTKTLQDKGKLLMRGNAIHQVIEYFNK